MSLDIKLVPVHDANNNPHDSLVDVNDKKDYKIFVNGKSYCDYTNVIINILVLDPILDAVLIHNGTPKPIHIPTSIPIALTSTQLGTLNTSNVIAIPITIETGVSGDSPTGIHRICLTVKGRAKCESTYCAKDKHCITVTTES